MQIALVTYFLAVAETGSIRAASERLRVSGSAISRQIQLAEHIFRAQLFDRSRNGMVLTEEGRSLNLHFLRIAQELSQARASIDEIRGLVTGHISISMIEGVARNWVFPCMQDFRRTFPGISFSVAILGTSAVTRSVLEEQVDIGIAIHPEIGPECETLARFQTRFVAVMSTTTDIATTKKLRLSALARPDLVLLDRGFMTRTRLVAAGNRIGLRFEPILELNHIDLLLSYLSTVGGVSVLPDYAVPKQPASVGLCSIPISTTELPGVTTIVFAKSGRVRSWAATEFIKRLVKDSRR